MKYSGQKIVFMETLMTWLSFLFVLGILKVYSQINRLSERHIVFSKYNQFYEKHSGHNAANNKGIPECLIFGGILAFLGLDEDSKLERKYDKEIKGTKDEDFDEKLRNVLRPAIVNMQVSRCALSSVVE